MLIGERSPLHRATPFKNFEALASQVPTMIKDVEEYHAPLLNPAEWEKLPKIIQEAPYYADGKLLIEAIRRMWDKMYKVVMTEKRCNAANNYSIEDHELIRYMGETLTTEAVSHYKITRAVEKRDCRYMDQSSVAFLWTITGWHRHVGMVADFYADPDLAGFSWAPGEAFSRPKQAMIMGVVAAVTGTSHPKLNEDFTHIFAGLEEEEQMKQVWRDFQADLEIVEDTIRKRNEHRHIKNYHALPSIVEASVAV